MIEGHGFFNVTFQGETPRIIQSTARFWAHRDSAPLFQGLLWCCWQLVFSGQWGQPDCLFGCWDAFVSEKLLWGHNHPDLSLIKQLHSESLVKMVGRLRKIRMSLNTILPDLRVKRQQKPVALASNSGWKTQTLWMEKFGCQARFFQHVSLQHDLDHVTTTLCSPVIFECPSFFNLNQPKQDQLRATREKKKHRGLFIQISKCWHLDPG